MSTATLDRVTKNNTGLVDQTLTEKLQSTLSNAATMQMTATIPALFKGKVF